VKRLPWDTSGKKAPRGKDEGALFCAPYKKAEKYARALRGAEMERDHCGETTKEQIKASVLQVLSPEWASPFPSPLGWRPPSPKKRGLREFGWVHNPLGRLRVGMNASGKLDH